jgi:hypothetical protein
LVHEDLEAMHFVGGEGDLKADIVVPELDPSRDLGSFATAESRVMVTPLFQS